MKKINFSLLRRIALAVLVIAVTLSLLASCGGSVKDKEVIIDRMESSVESGGRGHDFVVDYIYDWGIKNLDTYKISWAERVYQSQYVYDGGLEDTLVHAEKTARKFLDEFYDNIDLKDSEAVTDAILYCYSRTVSDPYSIYRVPTEDEEYVQNLSGNFTGIGVAVTLDYEAPSVLITEVFRDSPAEKVGILPGDYIYAVDGKTIPEIGIENVTNSIKGETGTSVNIMVKRGEEFLSFNPVRASITEYTVKYEVIENNIGYVQITDFKKTTYNQFVEAIDALEESEVVGIVFDLRSNPGGYLDIVCKMLSYMIPNGHPIVSYQYKGVDKTVMNSANDVHPTKKDDNGNALSFDHKINVPVVVICNENTASAGEIFTAAVRDYREWGLLDAKIVGVTTYKKGVMQNTYRYHDGASITLTVAYYNPPCGVNYHGTGVTPDVIVEAGIEVDDQYNAALEELKKLIK